MGVNPNRERLVNMPKMRWVASGKLNIGILESGVKPVHLITEFCFFTIVFFFLRSKWRDDNIYNASHRVLL